MKGIELIAKERKEQIEKHGWDDSHDDKHTDLSLRNCAIYNLTKDDNFWPSNWDVKYKKKMDAKNYKENLIVAGALIAAEIDRLNRAGE